MRKRHLKKIALRRDMRPYRQARSKGSKALRRRWASMRRHWRFTVRANDPLREIRRAFDDVLRRVREFSACMTPAPSPQAQEDGRGN